MPPPTCPSDLSNLKYASISRSRHYVSLHPLRLACPVVLWVHGVTTSTAEGAQCGARLETRVFVDVRTASGCVASTRIRDGCAWLVSGCVSHHLNFSTLLFRLCRTSLRQAYISVSPLVLRLARSDLIAILFFQIYFVQATTVFPPSIIVSLEPTMFSSLCTGRVILLALLPSLALAAPIQHTPRQLNQLKGLLGGGKGQAANPLAGLTGGAGLDKLLGKATGGAKQVRAMTYLPETYLYPPPFSIRLPKIVANLTNLEGCLGALKPVRALIHLMR